LQQPSAGEGFVLVAETYMFDTDICSYVIKNRPAELKKIFLGHKNDNFCISVITYAELLYGLERKPSDKLAGDIGTFAALVQIVDWTHTAAQKYAKIRHFLNTNGKIIGDLDMQIAAAALAANATLVTHNQKHFSMVPGLIIEDWLL
jgi:tRNA(fMet)-specific endonuclease VapC